MRPDTTLVSIMMANNEIGVIEPIAELARIAPGPRRATMPTRYRSSARFPST